MLAGKPRHSDRYLDDLLRRQGTLVRSLTHKLTGRTRLRPSEAGVLVQLFLSHWDYSGDPHSGDIGPRSADLYKPLLTKPEIEGVCGYIENCMFAFGLEEALRANEDDLRRLTIPPSAASDPDVGSSDDRPSVESSSVPIAIAGVISPVDFTASRGQPVRAKPSAEVQPVFKTPVDRRDHKPRLALCQTTAMGLIKMLEDRRFNVRDAYRQALSDYVKHLPPNIRDRNLLFADQEARILRDLFAADAVALPPEFASRLRAMLQAHMALRVFYPQIERFYDDVRFRRTADPLPIDAADKINTIVAQAPEVFDSSVGQALSDAAPPMPPPLAAVPHEQDTAEVQPPADPFGTLPTEKAQAYLRAGIVNRLWAVFQKGETLNKSSEAWAKIGHQLVPYVRPILEWLSNSGSPQS